MSLLKVSAPPHISTKNDTSIIMLDVIIALMPAMLVGAYVFGYRAVLVVATCTIFAVLFEYLWTKLMKLPTTIGDLSAVVSGILLGFNLPPTAPLWMCAAGSFFMMIIVKAFFGGLGQNFVNPALAARVFLMASWPTRMIAFAEPFSKIPLISKIDAVTSPTALSIVKNGLEGDIPTNMQLFLGNVSGCIGEVSALALLIGFLYLLIRKVISWRIPVVFIGVTGLLSYAFGGSEGLFTGDFLFSILSGSLFLGAIFMATDYTTSPVTKLGQYIYAIGCGAMVFIIRKWGGYPEGVSYAILLMNVATPLIDKITPPKKFGRRKAQ